VDKEKTEAKESLEKYIFFFERWHNSEK